MKSDKNKTIPKKKKKKDIRFSSRRAYEEEHEYDSYTNYYERE